MSRAEFSMLYEAHALGALDPADEAAFRAHLATGCEECVRGVAEAEAAVAAIGFSVAPEAPPAGARERLLAAARGAGTETSSRRAPPARRRPWAPVALAVGLALLGLWWAYSALLSRPADPTRLVALLADPRTPRLVLAAGETPVGTAVYDAESRRILVFAPHLAAPAPGRVHVLWYLPKAAGGAPRNVGAFARDAASGAHAVVREAGPFSEVGGIAISEETDPRTPTPTKVVAAGTH